MARGWLKSLQCKSIAVDEDHHTSSPSLKKRLLPLSSCSSSHSLRDVHPSIKPSPSPSSSGCLKPPPPSPDRKKQKPKPKSKSLASPRPPPVTTHTFPALEELQLGHPSRRVVELIFTSSWSPGVSPFPGKLQMLFRVHNTPHTLARFEAHRSTIRLRSGSAARCAADGNEMMRFHCNPSNNTIYDARVSVCIRQTLTGKAVEVVRTFAVSGAAHESGGGGGGRRAMLVCRVIAGRVRSEFSGELGCDSVSAGAGELLVLDQRGVLPCFLIIYKV